MTTPPITSPTGITGSVAYWHGAATAVQDIALERLKGTLTALVAGHNETIVRLAAAEKRIAELEAKLALVPFPFQP